jgi:sugar phosphate isomerase/epimerase
MGSPPRNCNPADAGLTVTASFPCEPLRCAAKLVRPNSGEERLDDFIQGRKKRFPHRGGNLEWRRISGRPAAARLPDAPRQGLTAAARLVIPEEADRLIRTRLEETKMAKTMKGPGIFLAQFAGDAAPFDSLQNITKWAAGLGYKGVQIPSWDGRIFDLKKAAESQAYCDEVKGICADAGVEITELSTHLQGQLVAVHPAYDVPFDAFAPAEVHNNPKARQRWAVEQVTMAARASRNLGLNASVSFSGALAFPYLYPWPQRPAGMIEEAFAELGRRWKPILDAYEEAGVDLCYEIHPGEDVFDGATFEMFLDQVGGHKRCNINYDPSHFLLQQLDYLAFIDIYHERIKAFHAKDAEFNPDGRQGVYSGYQSWIKRAGRFRSLGDGQVDFGAIFSKLAAYDYDSWAVLEWECALKHPEDGAAEGAPFIAAHIIRVTERSFDDFTAGKADLGAVRKLMGIG